MKINIFNNKGSIVKKEELVAAFNAIETDYNKSITKLGIILLTDEKLLELNVKYLKSSTYTDIISFNYSENESEIEGELYISRERIKENSIKYKTTEKEELYRVIIHGVLHLAGEEDKEKEERKRMQGKENQYLSRVCFT